jgi:hypothetical protein
MNENIKRRRLIIRSALIVIWIALGVIIFVLNRGHSLLVDNHSVEAAGLRAPDNLKISVDGGKALEFFRNDRDIFEVGGGTHRVKVEFSDGTPAFTGTFKLPLKYDMYILSIPRMINNAEPFVEAFLSNDNPVSNNDEGREE